MKKSISMAIMTLTLLPSMLMAQDNLKAFVQADLISHYMWRGQDLGGVSLQPQFGIAWKGLSLKTSGNAGFDQEDRKELDLTIGYQKYGFNIGVTDYWQSDVDPENRYFYYDEKKGPHQFEGNIGYTCKYGSIQAYTMFWGNDFKVNGDRAFSTYIELSVPFRAGGLDWDLRAGVTPMESAGYTTKLTTPNAIEGYGIIQYHYFYGEGFTCNRASIRATKTLTYKNLNLPIFAELHTNPNLKKANLLVGISAIAF